MSSTEMFIVLNSGKVVGHAEFKNSYRGAHMIWGNLFNAYCPKLAGPKRADQMRWSSEDFDGSVFPTTDAEYRAVWDLAKDPKFYMPYRIVLAATFDWVILESEKIQTYIDAVYSYASQFSSGHLLDQVKVLEKLKKRKIVGVCWNQTSVCDMWHGNGRKLYDVHDHEEPWFLFKDFLEKSAE